MEPAFNPHLQPCSPTPADQGAGKGYIEMPDNAVNLRWQTRTAAPTDYENTLADMLEQIYESGAETAEDIVEGLNSRDFNTASGDRWTVASLMSELAELGR